MASLLLWHGAGSDRTQSTLVAVDEAVGRASPGVTTVRADFPYRKRPGRRPPDREPVLLQAIRDEIAVLPPGPIVLGGRSMGGRMCSILAAGPTKGLFHPASVAGVVMISYPLHPPGKLDRLRVEHFPRLHLPCLFIHGTRDAFGTPDELSRWTATIPGPVEHVWIERGTHELRGADAQVADAVVAWTRQQRIFTRKRAARPRG